jgi:hypothetical protein
MSNEKYCLSAISSIFVAHFVEHSNNNNNNNATSWWWQSAVSQRSYMGAEAGTEVLINRDESLGMSGDG